MLYNNKATDVLGDRPNCDLCNNGTPAMVDGKTVTGAWAYMCTRHFAVHGRGLGLGIGQVLLCGDAMDAPLIEGLGSGE